MNINNTHARGILCNMNNTVTPRVKSNRELVDEFLDKFRATLTDEVTPTSYTLHIIHGGSAYENLAVDYKTDFDITVSLGRDFVSENFDVKRDKSGFFVLEAKKHMMHLDCNNLLDSSKVRNGLFNAMRRHIDMVTIPDTTIIHKESLSAVTVELQEHSGLRRRVSIDLVPQIPFRTWGQCPDLLPLGEMPECLRKYIDRTNKNKSPCMFFAVGIPKASRYPNSDQLFNISFSLLEKNFVNEETDIRDMVRLVKYIAKRRDWKDRHHFKSFYAKRVAVKYYDELKGKEPWDGCLRLLKGLEEEVSDGVIDGYFVGNQPLREWDDEEARDFIREIRIVRNMNIRDI
ncbi:cyclic GMP-AMP synthase-like receptor 1 [Macrobrachium rosenbergii]|uniref:cyclic GMP-AMP synthase-like receptor 1 n=1 Tax=Macrobrachium rosenbergii TaxID=79674 RepID=UPI0034D46C26